MIFLIDHKMIFLISQIKQNKLGSQKKLIKKKFNL
jgi:hypothetical protein